jgi:hypothetical protein
MKGKLVVALACGVATAAAGQEPPRKLFVRPEVYLHNEPTSLADIYGRKARTKEAKRVSAPIVPSGAFVTTNAEPQSPTCTAPGSFPTFVPIVVDTIPLAVGTATRTAVKINFSAQAIMGSLNGVAAPPNFRDGIAIRCEVEAPAGNPIGACPGTASGPFVVTQVDVGGAFKGQIAWVNYSGIVDLGAPSQNDVLVRISAAIGGTLCTAVFPDPCPPDTSRANICNGNLIIQVNDFIPPPELAGPRD